MITYERMTLEDALLKAFKDDSRAIDTVLSSDNDATITATIKFDFPCPARYAKVILIDYLTEKLGLPGVKNDA